MRRQSRYQIQIPVRFQQHETVGLGRTREISGTEVFVESRNPVMLGKPILVVLEWPVPFDDPILLRFPVRGKVIRSTDSGFAVRIHGHASARRAGSNG